MLYLIQYEGFIGHCASTNNRLESLNSQIKLAGTFRQPLSIKEFLREQLKSLMIGLKRETH